MKELIASILGSLKDKAFDVAQDAVDNGDPLGNQNNEADSIITELRKASSKIKTDDEDERKLQKALEKVLMGKDGLPSDEDLKNVIKKWKKGEKIDEKDYDILRAKVPNRKGKHIDDAHMWEDDVLDDYIDYIYNYEYTYKPEATKVDPSIDPEQKHIGIMAQDLEKVNPAAVIKDPSGFLKVDTGRLALMNAGAIAELGRRLNEVVGKEGKNG